jgi:hypothetical protein
VTKLQNNDSRWRTCASNLVVWTDSDRSRIRRSDCDLGADDWWHIQRGRTAEDRIGTLTDERCFQLDPTVERCFRSDPTNDCCFQSDQTNYRIETLTNERCFRLDPTLWSSFSSHFSSSKHFLVVEHSLFVFVLPSYQKL